MAVPLQQATTQAFLSNFQLSQHVGNLLILLRDLVLKCQDLAELLLGPLACDPDRVELLPGSVDDSCNPRGIVNLIPGGLPLDLLLLKQPDLVFQVGSPGFQKLALGGVLLAQSTPVEIFVSEFQSARIAVQ